MIKISGVIGLSILRKNNNYYFIFYDDHDNKEYCINKMLFISDIFNNLSNNNHISFYIEDYYENQEENYIWKNNESLHLKKFNNMIHTKKNNKNWYFTDIRLYLGNTLGIKLNNLDYIFNLKKNLISSNFDKKINKIKLQLEHKSYSIYFNNLKQKYIKLKHNFKNNLESSNLYQFYYKGYLTNKIIFEDKLYEIELLIDSLMELYTIIIINNTFSKLNFLNYGLFHSVNLAYYLKISKSDIIYETGITDKIFTHKFNLNNLDNTKSCIYLDINKIKSLII